MLGVRGTQPQCSASVTAIETAAIVLERRDELTEQQTVSFDNEPLILVDADDNVTGFAAKVNAHCDGGLLHRAFSVFLFTDDDLALLRIRIRI